MLKSTEEHKHRCCTHPAVDCYKAIHLRAPIDRSTNQLPDRIPPNGSHCCSQDTALACTCRNSCSSIHWRRLDSLRVDIYNQHLPTSTPISKDNSRNISAKSTTPFMHMPIVGGENCHHAQEYANVLVAHPNESQLSLQVRPEKPSWQVHLQSVSTTARHVP